MSSAVCRWKSRDLLGVILFLQFMIYTSVFFDVQVVRQVIGFLYLTFIPGMIMLKLLKLGELDGLEIILFSAGFSIAFLMFAGLLINELSFLFGIAEPLALMPLMIVLNGFILVGGILTFSRSESVKLLNFENLKLHPLALLFVGLPVLSVVGTLWVNAFENNLILLFLIIAISSLFVITAASKKFPSLKLYPFSLLMIAISLLYHSSLISNYILPFGSDVPVEYYFFKTTQINAYWSSTNHYLGDTLYGRINSMLSVTILPTIYSNLLNMDPTWVFKIIFPLLFSFVPLGLYQLWKEFVREKYAFISAFLFMAFRTFYTELLGLNREMVAELFFVLLLLVVLNKKMKPSSKIMFFTVFAFGLTTSHYGLSEIFLFFISLIFILLVVAKRPSKSVTVSMIVLFSVIMFTWYIYTSDSAPFNSLLEFGDYVYGQLDEFLNPASRGQTVLRGLGMESAPTIWNSVSRVFAYSTQFLIVVGFLSLVTKRIKVNVGREYFTFSFVAMAFLTLLILVPGLANTMNMTRFYHILLFFLAPLCVMGSEVLIEFVSKRKKESRVSILLLIVLVPYFLFQTGFVYEITGSESWSVPLSNHRMSALQLYGYFGYMDERSVFGAQWLSKNVDAERKLIYADIVSTYFVLTSYGMIYRGSISILSNATRIEANGTLYLGQLNVAEEKIVGMRRYMWNYSEFPYSFNDMNKIYSNSGSEVYRSTTTIP